MTISHPRPVQGAADSERSWNFPLQRVVPVLGIIVVATALFAESENDARESVARPVLDVGRVSLPENELPLSPAIPNHLVGMNSCSLSHCHGGDRGTEGAEYAIWIQDPHSRAYDGLRSQQSRQIAERLKMTEAPHQAGRCLACHAVDTPKSTHSKSFSLTDGVSCEVCHGAAERWVVLHTKPEWKQLTSGEKLIFGFNDTKSVLGRTQLCSECHVGGPGKEVNHDLIAAGHPPLHFEMAGFHDVLLKHWLPKQDEPNLAQLWLVGQAALAKAQLRQIVASPHDQKTLEFANFDCYACHADLKDSDKVASPDVLHQDLQQVAWGDWTTTLLDSLTQHSTLVNTTERDAVRKVQDEIRLVRPGTEVDDHVLESGIKSLEDWAGVSAVIELPPSELKRLLLAITDAAPGSTRSWYESWQKYLGFRAVYLSLVDSNQDSEQSTRDPELEQLLVQLRNLLEFPEGYNSPAHFDATEVSLVMSKIRTHVYQRYQ